MDNGSTHNFLKKLGLPQAPNSHIYVVSLINGYDNNVWDRVVMGVQIEVQGLVMHLDFCVMHMTRVALFWVMSGYMAWVHC